MSAGRGIRHSEVNASAEREVHLVQMWVLPDTRGVAAGYEQLDVTDALARGVLVPVASGQGHESTITIHQRDAVLYAGRLGAGTAVAVPAAPHVHVFVPSSAELGTAATGGAARLTDAGSPARRGWRREVLV
jgi:redox-sensitive bicupin YhaK (pirin superfamily)